MTTWFTIFAIMTFTFAMGASTRAEEAKVVPLFAKELVGNQNDEVTMLTVTLAPGEVDASHRHNAQVFVYVLEGSVIMKLKGKKQLTLSAGQTFYEGPNDIHVIGRNNSKTKSAKFLVFFVKKKGAPILVPVKTT